MDDLQKLDTVLRALDKGELKADSVTYGELAFWIAIMKRYEGFGNISLEDFYKLLRSNPNKSIAIIIDEGNNTAGTNPAKRTG